MNKAELIEHVAKQTEMTKADAQRAVEAVFGGITATLKKGNDARFVGFGTFSVAKRAATTGRNPRTGEAIKIPASKNAKFKAGKELKEAVNKK
ncbi:MAG: HU family DNA-binding protein [Alphaproteobacteria bacterium]|nr:HU family DNA-binding protein [Alphaproteobacteria bacterium]NCQ88119.1 HU family DNA-binding protein [Alphaproteobacteria bacterium]NCT05374.1 HU family DNA-binding protein [Alphaproteobacteria bacterium]